MKKIPSRFLYLLLILCIICTSLLSCAQLKKQFDADIKLLEFVPGVYDYIGFTESYEAITRDRYGRCLTKGQVYFLPTGKVEEIYAIMQKYDDNGIYIYEDNNYIFAEYGDIEELKKRNDWNTPIDETKISYKKASYSIPDGVTLSNQTNINMTTVLDKFIEQTGISKDEITFELNCDIDSEGNCLNMYVHEGDTRKVYAVVCNNDYDIKYLVVELNENYQKQISNLKQQIGWIYK